MEFLGLSLPSYGWSTILGSAISGVFLGSIYALVALGLTLIYGVLHIINFAHGALLMLAMYAVYFLWAGLGIDPYLAMLIVVPGGFVFGYGLQRMVIGKASHGKDEIILLVTLGIAIVIEVKAKVGLDEVNGRIDIACIECRTAIHEGDGFRGATVCLQTRWVKDCV